MNKDVYPGEVDFNYKIRCDQHYMLPYEYCEMCMIRTNLQNYLTEASTNLQRHLSSSSLAIHVLNDITEKHRKQIAELQIEINLIKEKMENK